MIEKLCEVLRLCYEISTSTDADVFFCYDPHINSFGVNFHEEGWENQKEATYLLGELIPHVDDKILSRAIAELEKLKEKLMPGTEDADERL